MAVSKAMITARKNCCAGGMVTASDTRPPCANWRSNPGWDSPSCGEPEQNRPAGVDLPGCGKPIDREALRGPADFCPLGFWAGVEPADIELIRRVSLKSVTSNQRERVAPQITTWMKELSGEAKTRLLENLVETGVLMPEIAEEVAVSEGLAKS